MEYEQAANRENLDTTDEGLQRFNRGAVVRHRTWPSRDTGTVVRREDSNIFVAWHNSFIEDELTVADVELVEDPTDQMKTWRGGIGIIEPDGPFHVEPVAEE